MTSQTAQVRRLVAATLAAGALAAIASFGRALPAPARAQPAATSEPPGPPPLGPAAAPPGAEGAATPAAAPPAPEQITATPTRTPTPINIGNFVWDDLDGDGRQDAGEPGIPGVAVQLWNATKTALLDSATTNASGLYTVTAPVPGDYRIRVLLPGPDDEFAPKDQAGGDDLLDSDINPTGPDFGFTDIFTLANNVISTTTRDAGIIVFRPPTPTRTPTPINIGNFIWHDLNQNGVQDAGEPGLPGITVQLWNAAKTQLIDQDITSGSGIYTVVTPLPGDFRIRVLLPSGASFTVKDVGADTTDSDINPFGVDSGFSDVFTLGSNVISVTTRDAGLINIIATATPSATRTPTRTATATATLTPTVGGATEATATATPPAGAEQRLHLPLLRR